jgi:polar amino acid transport system substrate-binding protein
MATIRAQGYLIAGVDQNTYQLEYLNPRDGTMEGFDIDMLHAVAAAIFGDPNKIKYVATTDVQRVPFVKSGRVDIVAHTMTITCAKLKDVDFSTVYFDAGQQILVEDGSPIHGVNDLAHRRVCATPASTSIARLSQYHAIQVPAQSYTDCLVLLQQGQVDAISTDNSILEGLKAQDPYATIVGSTFSDEPYGLAISQLHPDFVRFVNAVLAQMRADGQWAASYQYWIGSPVPAPPPVRYQG